MRNSEPRSDPARFHLKTPDANYRGQWENRTYQSRSSTPQNQQRPFSQRTPNRWEYTEQRQGRNYGYQPEMRESSRDDCSLCGTPGCKPYLHQQQRQPRGCWVCGRVGCHSDNHTNSRQSPAQQTAPKQYMPGNVQGTRTPGNRGPQ